MPDRVFEDAAVETGFSVFQKEGSTAARAKNTVQFTRREEAKPEPVFTDVRRIPQKAFAASPVRVFDTSISPETEAVKAKMRGGPSIGEMYDVKFGLKTGDDAKFTHRTKGLHKEDKRLLRGDDVWRHGFCWGGEYVWYVPKKMTAHRATARPGEPARFEHPKVLVKDTTKQFACAYEPGDYYVKDVLVVIPKQGARDAYDLRFVAGVINSSALRFFYRTTYSTLHVQNGELAALPLPRVDMKKPNGRAKHDALVGLVEKLIRCRAELAEAQTEADSVRLGNRCDALDAHIEQAVNQLYGLSPADRKVVADALRALYRN